MESGFKGFSPQMRKFFRDLSRNNNREWFLQQKEVYERAVKQPMLQLVLSVGGAVQNFAPEMVTDPKRAIYRIHRDTRFSADKTPYKTHVSAIFAPRGLPKHSGASLYFELSNEEVLMAGGIYMPGPAELRAVRQHIAVHHHELKRIVSSRRFRKQFGELEGDRLSRAPREFSQDHPALEFLRYKQLYVSASAEPSLAESPLLSARIVLAFAAMMPLVRFLNEPLLKMARLGRFIQH